MMPPWTRWWRAGSPGALEAIVGWASFCGLRIVVAPDVFVPRRRTQLLVAEALRIVRHEEQRNPRSGGAFRDGLSDRVVVVGGAAGRGGGRGDPGRHGYVGGRGFELHAADVDPRAITCAWENIGRRGEVHTGDLYDALPDRLRGRVDLLVANAPYVPTAEIPLMPPEARDHEPTVALDGGPDGLDVQRRIIGGAPSGWRPEVTCSSRPAVVRRPGRSPPTRRPDSSRGWYHDDLDATAVVGYRP